MNLVRVFVWAELVAQFTRVSGGRDVRRLHVLPQPRPQLGLPAARGTGGTHPPAGLLSVHVPLYL